MVVVEVETKDFNCFGGNGTTFSRISMIATLFCDGLRGGGGAGITTESISFLINSH